MGVINLGTLYSLTGANRKQKLLCYLMLINLLITFIYLLIYFYTLIYLSDVSFPFAR